ncbi:MAG: hypothetical protein H0W40_11375 [Methylibium sp.]|uniref:hypothetical protein n=1 Tax=Methylibium sp. TaxID=2067992 RepID=UPI0017A57504|nr:hypothetical protein [Methylibium sp.]MBA3597958.1 hypothetical protein [Methylibium sp.]
MAENLLADPVAPETPLSPDEELGRRLFGSMTKPESPPPPADATPEERLFGGMHTHGDAQRGIATTMIEHDGMSREQANAVAGEWAPVFAEAGLSNTEASTLAEVGAAIYQRPASDEQRQQWASMAREALQADYRPDGVAQALADAKVLVQRLAASHPGIVAWLEAGAGDHPQVVRVIAARARELRKAGRL